jgi:hypothetical protein
VTIQLICGDCRDIMPTLGKVDAVITDPPYGDDETHAGHLSGVTLRNGEAARRPLGFVGMNETECLSMTAMLLARTAGWVVFTCEWHYMEALHREGYLTRFGIWRKRNGAPQFTGDRPGTGWEAIAICHNPGKKAWNGGGRHGFYDIPKIDSEHPCGKPLALMEAFVEDYSNPGDTILDPFMGSGTTGVACKALGRNFIGIDICEDYVRIARRRIDAPTGPLFRSPSQEQNPAVSTSESDGSSRREELSCRRSPSSLSGGRPKPKTSACVFEKD